MLSGICTAPEYRLSCRAGLGDLHAAACTSCWSPAFPSCLSSLTLCTMPGHVQRAWLACFSCLWMALPAQAALKPSQGGSFQAMHGGIIACLERKRPVELTTDVTACCCRWLCTTTPRCCQTTSLEESRSAAPAVPHPYVVWGATTGHHVQATGPGTHPRGMMSCAACH